MIISFILYLIGIPIVYRNHKVEKIYIQYFISPISIYLFSFVGAYNAVLALNFSPKILAKIILIIYIFIILYAALHKVVRSEIFGLGKANMQDHDLAEAVQSRIKNNTFNDDLYQKLMQMAILKNYYFVIISFVVFLIFPRFGNTVYFGIPDFIAKMFS